MNNLEQISMQIISRVGAARSLYIEAIQAAKQKDYDQAQTLMQEGDLMFREGHEAHLALFQTEVDKEFSTAHILLMHAEDQFMSAEGFKILAAEFIELYQHHIHRGNEA